MPLMDKELTAYIVAFIATLALIYYTADASAEDHTQRPGYPVWQTTCTRSQMCTPGWSATVRPPGYWTNQVKHLWLPEGGVMSDYELDHNGPIVLCGAPKDKNNLWLQLWHDARKKDAVENKAHKDYCAGRITLKQAQQRVEEWR